MQNTFLEELKKHTTIVADTGDLKAIERLRPLDATTNPSLITKALMGDEYKDLLKRTLQSNANDIEKSIDALTIEMGKQILGLIEGRVSTEIDANLAFDTQRTLENARRYIEEYSRAGIGAERILIKIPATWEGIKAAETLEREGIHCNLTLIFDLHQAQAAADAGVKLISPFVGRILDWQKNEEQRAEIAVEQDMGVNSVKKIYQYYKQHEYATEIMGASFRSIEQIIALAGCDFLTISPELLDELAQERGELEIFLREDMEFEKMQRKVLTIDEYFAREEASKVTKDLLGKGIKGFIQAKEDLGVRLAKLV